MAGKNHVLTLYADRVDRRWVVRDPEGDLWVLPHTDTPWDDRQPFSPAEGTDLEVVPGHYLTLFGLTHRAS